jgi:hypothetical protein
MSLKSPSQSFENYVRPAWECFSENSGEEWAAFAAARATHSQHEWVFHYYERYDKGRLKGAKAPHEFRQALGTECPDIEIVKDVADAAGHRILERGESRIITAATAAFLVKEGQLWISGTDRLFTDVLGNVVEFWRNWQD